LMSSWIVIGGGGFLGRRILELLLEKGEKNLKCFDLRNTWKDDRIQFIEGDLTNFESISAALKGVTTVINTATASPGAPRSILEKINVEGTKNLIEACFVNGVKQLIYTSSSSVVFDGKDIKNGSEDSLHYLEFYPDAYNDTKAQAEKLVLQANGQKGLMTCALRPSGIFGPRDNTLVPQMLDVGRTKKSRFAQIGDGKNLFDYTFVDNIAYAHLLASEKLKSGSPVGGQAYFITNGEPIPFWDFPKYLWREFGYPQPIIYLPKFIMWYLFAFLDMIIKFLYPILKKNPMFFLMVLNTTCTKTFSIEKAKKELGYKPIVSMEEGLQKTVNWYKNEGKWSDKK